MTAGARKAWARQCQNGDVTNLRRMTFEPPDGLSTSVELLTFDQLRNLDRGTTQRADFHVLVVVKAGVGSVTIDFRPYPLAQGSVAWIRPGSVHRWDNLASLAGDLVLFTPTAPALVDACTPSIALGVKPVWSVATAAGPLVGAALGHLRLEGVFARHGQEREHVAGLLLSTLLVRIEPPGRAMLVAGSTFDLFQLAVEEHFRQRHDAAFYAQRLGFAPRTLSRAVQSVTGATAKAYIEERITLEAKRLLVHHQLAATRCAAELGFLDASSFSVFFRRSTGLPPGAWRDLQPGGGVPKTYAA